MKAAAQEIKGYVECEAAELVPSRPSPQDEPTTIHPSAVIGRNVRFGRGVVIAARVVLDDGVEIGDRVRLHVGAYVGKGVSIGDDSIIDPHVTIREGCILGRGVHVHCGAVIGSDGFGFAPTGNGNKRKIPQVGIVEIGDEAVIGANCTIDRATLGRTIVGRKVKIENLVQVAHNVRIGDETIVGAQTGICGSCSIGASVRIGRNVGMVGHIRVEDGCEIEPFSGISKNVPANSHLTGFPAVPPEADLERRRLEEGLPGLYERVRQIEKQRGGQPAEEAE